jgi:hypothetical protein
VDLLILEIFGDLESLVQAQTSGSWVKIAVEVGQAVLIL